MLRKLLVAVALLLAAEVAAAAALYQAVGWWALPALVAINAVALPLLAKHALAALVLLPFKAKGAALRGASARVHSVTPAQAPPRDEVDEGEDEDDGGPREWYSIDVTVTPATRPGGFSHWEPGELVLVRPGAKAVPGDDDGEVGTVRSLEVWTGAGFAEDEQYKYEGEQRLRLLAGVRPGTARARFRYYFEIFGEVELPGRASRGAGA